MNSLTLDLLLDITITGLIVSQDWGLRLTRTIIWDLVIPYGLEVKKDKKKNHDEIHGIHNACGYHLTEMFVIVGSIIQMFIICVTQTLLGKSFL